MHTAPTPATGSRRTATRRTPPIKRAPAITFPDLPRMDSGEVLYWRAAWIRSVGMTEAMRRFTERSGFSRLPRPLRLAAITSERLLAEDTDRDLRTLTSLGGLMYAWIPESGVA